MKIVVAFFSVLSAVICITVVEDKAENVQNGGEIISEKVITETKSVSSGGSAAVGHVDGKQKVEDEKILEEVYSKGKAVKDKLIDERIAGKAVLGEKLLTNSQVHHGKALEDGLVTGVSTGGTLRKEELKQEEAIKVGSTVAVGHLSATSHAMVGNKKEIVAEEVDHHLIGDEQKKHGGSLLVKEAHHQAAASHKIGGDHLLESHPVGNLQHIPVNLHDAKLIADQSKHFQQIDEVHTTKIIHEKKVTNHQVSSQMGHDHVNPIIVHHPVVISTPVIHPHPQKVMHHKLEDHMIVGHAVHDKLPSVHPPGIVQSPHQETLHQLAAIRLINQQLREAMVQNQQAALVGQEIQRQLEMKEKYQKLMAMHHVPHIVPIREHMPINRRKHDDHLNKHDGHHQVTVLEEVHHTSLNKHELSKMRHLANEMHSPRMEHPKLVHSAADIHKDSLGAEVAKGSIVEASDAGEVVMNREKANIHATGIETAQTKRIHGDLVGMHEDLKGKEIASDLSASKGIGLETAKEILKDNKHVDMLADESVKKMDSLKRTDGALAGGLMIKGLDTLADKSLKEIGSAGKTEGLVIKKSDILAEKSLKNLANAKKSDEVPRVLKSANFATDQAINIATNKLKKTEGVVLEGAIQNVADTAVGQTMQSADITKKTEGAIKRESLLNAASGQLMNDAIKQNKDGVAKEEILKMSKKAAAFKNIEGVLVGDAVIKEALGAEKSLKEKDVAKKSVVAARINAATKEANILADKSVEGLYPLKNMEDTIPVTKGVGIEELGALKEIDPIKDRIVSESAMPKAIIPDMSMKNGDDKKIKTTAIQDAILKLAANTDEKVADIIKTIDSTVTGGAELKEKNKVAENEMKQADTIKESEGAEGIVVAGDVIIKRADTIADKTVNEAEIKKTGAAVDRDVALKVVDVAADNALKVVDTLKKTDAVVAQDATLKTPKVVADNVMKITDTIKTTDAAVTQNATLNTANVAADSAMNVPDIIKMTEAAIAQDATLKTANVAADSAKAANTAKKIDAAVAQNAMLKNADVVADSAVKVADTIKKSDTAVTQDVTLKTANVVADNAVNAADTLKNTAAAVVEDAQLKAANVVADKAVNVADIIQKADPAIIQDGTLKTANVVADNALKAVDTVKNTAAAVVEDAQLKAANVVADKAVNVADTKLKTEVIAEKTEDAVVQEVDKSVKEKGAVDVISVNGAKLETNENSVVKNETGIGKQLLDQIAINDATDKSDTVPEQTVSVKRGADKDALTVRARIKNSNVNVASGNKNVQEVGMANFASGMDDALIRRESQQLLSDKSIKEDALVKKNNAAGQDDKATDRAKMDGNLRRSTEIKVAVGESISGKDTIEKVVNERLKNDKATEETAVNMENTKKKEEDKKIDILQKNMVDERMATGGDTSKNEPIFTLKEGSTEKMDNDQSKVKQR